MLPSEVQSELLAVQQNFPPGSFLHLSRLTLEEQDGGGHYDKISCRLGRKKGTRLSGGSSRIFSSKFFFFKQIVRKDGGVRREPKEIKKAEKSMKPKILQNT